MAEITLPQLGETVTEGTITKWFKKVGDSVALDEPLFEVSTDKVDTEVPSPISGVLTEIRVAEGDTVPVGTVIAVVGDASAAPAAAAPAASAPAPTAAPAPAPAPAPVASTPAAASSTLTSSNVSESTPASATGSSGTSAVLSPVVRKLIAENNLNSASITGTGPGGRITRDDVLAAISRGGTTSAPAPAAAVVPTASAPQRAAAPRAVAGARDEVVALSKIRQATGAHMVASKAISPHVLSVVEVDYANVDVTRLRVKEEFKAQEGFSLTYLPFIARAVVDALADFPHMNSSLGDNELIVHRYVDLGIAVDLDYQGLLVPVVRDAEGKRLRALSREINDLATRTRSRHLSPDEISGGTFTISNNGSAGSVLTMPVINQPQVAILSTDAITKKPVVIEVPGFSESIAIHPVGNLAMAWDHRAFDGAYAAGFLSRVKLILETRDWSSEV
ncbi:MAG: 2-oxo acid dehydrogenase subunit E2 [Ilumatobacteraceae bacterium]|jgi:pyruvate dehydrogenase E2 component (dihydrolipoamide acetyltransferase)|nr:2-oxo acid dehydrogenase subunit E2 [Ilumatobacteraceae bacterium]